MAWQNRTAVLGAATTVVCLFATQSAANILYGNDYGYRGLMLQLTLMRIAMMVFSIGFGFALGWFCSPQAHDLRRLLLLGVAGLTVLLAVFNNGVLGWGSAWVVSFVGFWVALGYWLGQVVKTLGETPTTFGSSSWADWEDLIEHDVVGDEGILIGNPIDSAVKEVFSYKGDRHLLTVAPTRSGKGTTQIVPNLLTYPGSVIVVDPKGENAKITAQARRDMGQEVIISDPWNIAQIEGFEPSRFNPLDWLQKGDVDITENAMILSDAVVVPEGESEPFWLQESLALLQGLILYVATDDEEAGHRNPGRVRELLLLDAEDQQALFTRMLNSRYHIVASTGARCLQKDEKLLSNVMASAQAQTHFLDSTRIQESLSHSDFQFEDLKKKPMTIYLVLPADRLNIFGRWLRLLIQQAITVNARNIDVQPDKPVLFILDEMAALGRLTMVEQAYGLMAGFGLQLWGIVQDLNQLERIYGKGWQSFISNTGMLNYFGSRDKMTAEYFSSLCGETTVWNFSSAVSRAFGTSSSSNGISGSSTTTTETDTRAASQRKLAYPDELMRMNKGKQLVFVENMPPLIARKTPWFENEDLKAKGVNLRD
ncbi:MAG: type IV secretory system conjugative DNA transfer family protein [Paracoccaceae bacterium]